MKAGAGVAVLVLGSVVVIAGFNGTWGRVWAALFNKSGSPSPGGGSGSGGAGGPGASPSAPSTTQPWWLPRTSGPSQTGPQPTQPAFVAWNGQQVPAGWPGSMVTT